MYISSAKTEKFCVDEKIHSIIAFSNIGKAYTVKGFEIPEGLRNTDGAIESLLALAENEYLVAAVAVFSLSDNILLLTKKGLVKRICVMEIVQSRKLGLSAISLNEADELVSATRTSNGFMAVVCATNGRAVVVNESNYKLMSKAAHGMCGIKLLPEESAFAIVVTNNALLIVSEKGMGKKLLLEDIKPTVRGGKGARIYPADTEAGDIKFVCSADSNGELEFLFSSGSKMFKNTQSVPYKSAVSKGNKIVSYKEEESIVRIEYIEQNI